MAARNPDKVQLDFPQLTADLIRELRLTGTIGLLELTDQVTPVAIVASTRPLNIASSLPAFNSAAVFSGRAAAPALNQVIVDTGALPAGVYDVIWGISYAAVNAAATLDLQWRNAANAANLAFWNTAISNSAPVGNTGPTSFSINLSLNERLRIVNGIIGHGGQVAGWIMAQIRPTP